MKLFFQYIVEFPYRKKRQKLIFVIPKGPFDPAIKDLNSRAAGIEQGLPGRLGNVKRKGPGKPGRRGPVLALRLLLLGEALLPPQP